ncbi:MAG: hypothetical protein AB1473_16655 [Thermodesulfobacteriota bacterium]
MPYEVYRTTAEHVIAAADFALQKPEGIDEQMLAAFLDVPRESAANALKMAEQLGLVNVDANRLYKPASPCVRYLATSVRENRAAILRFVLDQYNPFVVFLGRLEISTGVVAQAATETKAICGITAHRDDIAQTLTDLGTYAQAISSQGAGLYIPAAAEALGYLQVLEEVIHSREAIELWLSRRLGARVCEWIDRNGCLENLITAYQSLSTASEDPRAPIVHAANALEWVLAQLGADFGVNLEGAQGINSKADRLANGRHLKKKHKFMIKYLGHVRNAADHGPDDEINQQWEVTVNTAIEYVHVTLSVIVDLFETKNEQFKV